MRNNKNNNLFQTKGMALIAVLWIVVLLTVIITVIAKASLVDTRVTMVSAEQMRSKWACRAGMEKAIAILSEDDKEFDGLVDLWYNNPEDFNDIELDQIAFTVEVIDEAGKMNLNVATEQQLLLLPYITEEIVDSILDWRDGDDTIRQGGAEGGYYLNLPNGYDIRNGDFKSVRELLRVKDITRELLYGSSYHNGWADYLTCHSYDSGDIDGVELVDVNSARRNQLMQDLEISRSHASWIMENRQFQGLGDLLSNNAPSEPSNSSRGNQAQPLDRQTYFEIIDKVKVGGQNNVPGKINLNTASEIVLLMIFDDNEEVVDEIIAYRSSSAEGFAGLSGLGEIASLKTSDIKKYIDKLTVRSNVFTIKSRSLAFATGGKGYAEAIVDRGKSPVEIIYYRRGDEN